MIEIENLTKKFGDFTAVDNLFLNIKKGEVLGFLGPNGAGKSTTMKMITGFIQPSNGIIKINNMNLELNPIDCKKLIGYLPEGAPLYGDMTPKNMLKFISSIRGMNNKEFNIAFDSVVHKTQIADVINQPIETLSKGYKRRVGLAQALIHNPEILILDEPTAGVDIELRHMLWDFLKKINQEGKTILLTTHYIEEAEHLCDRIAIIDNGNIIINDTTKKLTEQNGHSKIFIECETIPSNLSLENFNYIIDEKQIIIDTGSPNKHLPEIMKKIGELNLLINNIEIKKTNLEQVFLKLTKNESITK